MNENEFVIIAIVIVSGWIPPAIALVIQWRMGKSMLKNAEKIRLDAEQAIKIGVKETIDQVEDRLKKAITNSINGKIGRTARDIEGVLTEVEEETGGLDFVGIIEKKIAQKFRDW